MPGPGPGRGDALHGRRRGRAPRSGSARVITTVGSEEPAGNDSASRSPALIASGLSRNWSASLSRSAPGSARARARPSTSEQTTMAARPGRRSTTVPTRRHRELASTRVGWPTPGHQGPEDPATEEHQRAGQHDERGGRDDDADGAGEAEAAGGREDGEQQGQQTERRRSSSVVSTASPVAASARRMAS